MATSSALPLTFVQAIADRLDFIESGPRRLARSVLLPIGSGIEVTRSRCDPITEPHPVRVRFLRNLRPIGGGFTPEGTAPLRDAALC